jgi:type IV pilus assembly protein PilM
VLGVAVAKALMDSYKNLFKILKLKLVMAAPQCLAFGSLFRHLDPALCERDFAILDIGHSSSRINIYSNGIFDTNRTIDIGCAEFGRRVADLLGCDDHIATFHMLQNTNDVMNSDSVREACGDIAINVMRAMNYYNYEKRDNTLENIYVCGGGAMIPQLIEELRESVALNVVPLTDLATDSLDGDSLISGPAAIGICWNQE